MARKKSTLHRVLTARHAAWSAARFAVGVAPALTRPLNFFPVGIAAREAAGIVLEDVTWREPLPMSPDLERFVVEDCARYDSHAPWHVWTGQAELTRRAVVLTGAEIHGHTGSIVQPTERRTITALGLAPNWNFVKPAPWLRDAGALPGRAFFTYRTGHYYHFLMDNALRLVDALTRLGAAEQPLTVVRHAGGGTLQDAFYRAAQGRWPNLAVRTLASHQKVKPDEVLWSAQFGTNFEWTPFDPVAVATLAEVFRSAYGLGAPARRDRLIYLSRGGAKLRRVTNEDRLIAHARANGFEVFEANSGNHAEQVRLFSEARAIVAVHGAGLANLLFAAPSIAVLEIFPENFTKSTFAWMAARRHMPYHRLVGGPGNYDQAFTLDPDAFAQALDELMAAAP